MDENGAQYACIYGAGPFAVKLVGNGTGDFHLNVQSLMDDSINMNTWQNESISNSEIREFSVSGANVREIPEFPTMIILPALLITATLMAAAIKRKKLIELWHISLVGTRLRLIAC